MADAIDVMILYTNSLEFKFSTFSLQTNFSLLTKLFLISCQICIFVASSYLQMINNWYSNLFVHLYFLPIHIYYIKYDVENYNLPESKIVKRKTFTNQSR